MAIGDLGGPSVFALALAVGVYLVLKPLFGFLERPAAVSAHCPSLAKGIATAVLAIAAVYVVGASLLYVVYNLMITVQARRRRAPCPWWFLALALTLLVAELLLAFRVVFLLQ